jgi:hypothetical protein
MRKLVLLPALFAILVGAPPALAWTWPVDGSVLQPFVLGDDPYASGQHRGIDVGAVEGGPVRAPAPGVVSFTGTVPGGGRTVTIQTADGFAVTLLHLGEVEVAEGDAVVEGARIAVAGWSGDPEHPVPSVHLGVRIAAETEGYLDPLTLLPAPASAPAPEAPAVEHEPEPALTPAGTPESDETTAPAIVPTTPSNHDEAEAAPATPAQDAQQVDVAATTDIGQATVQADGAPPGAGQADVTPAPLQPLVVVQAGDSAPSDGHAASTEAVSSEPEARIGPHTAAAGAEEAMPVKTPLLAEGRPAPGEAEAVAPPSHDARPDQPRGRAVQREPVDRSHRVRAERRTEPVADGRAHTAGSGAGFSQSAAPGLSRLAEEAGLNRNAPEASATTWLWRAALPTTLLAALGLVLLLRGSGRSGPGTADSGVLPSGPSLGATQGAEPDRAVAPVAPFPRGSRLPGSRPRRRLERGGPGGPVKRPMTAVRGRRASV